MRHNRISTAAAVALALGVATTPAHGGQARRQPGQAAESVTVRVSIKAGGQSLTSSGAGTCTHAPQGSIYNVLAEMWTVRQQQGESSNQLTLWRPLDGKEEMFSLHLSGRRNVDVSTVRGGTISGSGTAKFQPAGKGGTITINAKTKSGEAVTGTIECSAFTPAVAEGG